ncbi:hypothetical protein CISG_09810 [Coccidioides immitis RMSCC 3703]|uniref:Uncharacterized protein n=1 Tax=Coccidioides immitis RMSCC 3703 TaxID=454286 RepID=A0A0J8QJN1_COCIT|nr:hypothetical protein CISG_09810 [Coccidioides immitis RMSCC 3703]
MKIWENGAEKTKKLHCGLGVGRNTERSTARSLQSQGDGSGTETPAIGKPLTAERKETWRMVFLPKFKRASTSTHPDLSRRGGGLVSFGGFRWSSPSIIGCVGETNVSSAPEPRGGVRRHKSMHCAKGSPGARFVQSVDDQGLSLETANSTGL